MIKIQIVSDIHLEYYTEYPGMYYFLKPSAPILILAGDICYYKHKNFIPFFEEVSQYFKYVIFVPGNHEYYTNSIIDLNFKSFQAVDYEITMMLEHLPNVKFLQKQTFVLNNIKFLGTTLWYDTPPTDKRFDNIVYTQSDKFILYNNHMMPIPKEIYNINRSQYYWLSNELNHTNGYYTIVITHYLPSKKCIADIFKQSNDNFLFYTECDNMFQKVNNWVYGHTHIGKTQTIGKSIVLANPRGLQKEQSRYKNYVYNKEYVIEVPSFSAL